MDLLLEFKGEAFPKNRKERAQLLQVSGKIINFTTSGRLTIQLHGIQVLWCAVFRWLERKHTANDGWSCLGPNHREHKDNRFSESGSTSNIILKQFYRASAF